MDLTQAKDFSPLKVFRLFGILPATTHNQFSGVREKRRLYYEKTDSS
jgi:hypothetical protein